MRFIFSVIISLGIGFQIHAERPKEMVKNIPSKQSTSPQQNEKFYEWLKEVYKTNSDDGFEVLTMTPPSLFTSNLKTLNCDIQTSALKDYLEKKQFKYRMDTTAMVKQLNQMKTLFCGDECKALEKKIKQRQNNIVRANEIIADIDKSCSKTPTAAPIKKRLTPQDVNHQQGIN